MAGRQGAFGGWFAEVKRLQVVGMWIQRKHRLMVLLAVLGGSVTHLLGVDSLLLKNGAVLRGTIVAQSRDQVIMRIGEGSAVFNKQAIRRIYDDITDKPPLSEVMPGDQLPPWWIPLTDLYAEDWVVKLELLPAADLPPGRFPNVPYVSFRANAIYELNIYGDPAKPAAIEIGYLGKGFHGKDAQKRCRQFAASYLSELSQIRALYSMDATGGDAETKGLHLEISRPEERHSSRGWSIVIYRPDAVAAATRPDGDAWRAAADRNVKLIAKSTEGETSWKKWSVQDAFNRLLPMERMNER